MNSIDILSGGLIHRIGHIDLNSQSTGFDAHINKIGGLISMIKAKYTDCGDFEIDITARFYKAGKGYKNKIRCVTIKFTTADGQRIEYTTGPIDKRKVDVSTLYKG